MQENLQNFFYHMGQFAIFVSIARLILFMTGFLTHGTIDIEYYILGCAGGYLATIYFTQWKK